MTQRSRRTIFYILLVLFPIIGAAVVLYAQGWRLALGTWRITKVGAILVRPYPTDVAITLDGEPMRNRAGLLSPSTLINNLAPGNYRLALKKPGYLDWTENATVLPSLVTEFKDAVLIPATPRAVGTTSIKDFFAASGELVLGMQNGTVRWRGQTVAHGTIVSESTDLRTLVTQDPATGAYLAYDFPSDTTTNISVALGNAGANIATIEEVTVDPFNDTLIVIKTARGVWLWDNAAGVATLVTRVPAGSTMGTSLAISQNRIAWTSFVGNAGEAGTSSIAIYDIFAKTVTTSTAKIAGTVNELAFIGGNTLSVLQNDGELFFYDINARHFQKIADTVKNFSVAPDGSAIAALETRSFELIPLSDSQTYDRFNLPDIQNITQIIWYKDSAHLFIVYPSSVAFLDLTDTTLSNLHNIAEGTHPLYNADQNVFYLLNPQGKLETFDFPS